jgi:2-polyprenyl-6-methoxyphenol hydroxylase-like FAD-dependent oxidoreductase
MGTSQRTQFLVVGAGLVGLSAALSLVGQGFDVRVIDRDTSHARSWFPVLLHAESLRILEGLGCCAAGDWRGRLVSELEIQTDTECASLNLAGSASAWGGVLVLPQTRLRHSLTQLLARRGVQIEWDTELSSLQQGEHTVQARVIRSSHAHKVLFPLRPAPREVTSLVADYVIGADGYESTVRSLLGLKLQQHGPLETFAFFEAAGQRSLRRATLALRDGTVNSAYPIPGGRSRFCFQIAGSLHEAPDLQQLQRQVAARLPGYRDVIGECERSSVVEFRRALAERFGNGRVWLAGEAAHATGPIGAQSVNVGIREASDLALALGEALRSATRFSFGEEYDATRTREWRTLLGLQPYASSAVLPSPVQQQLQHLVACLPAAGDDLSELLERWLAEARSPAVGLRRAGAS